MNITLNNRERIKLWNLKLKTLIQQLHLTVLSTVNLLLSRWKEAMAYASTGNWQEAEGIWKLLYQSSSSETKRAKLASNIALTEEMQGRLCEAHDWANKAADLFLKSEGSESDNTKLLKAYQEVLRLRIQSDQKLNIQIGNKD